MSGAGSTLPNGQRKAPDSHLAAIIESSDDAIISKTLEGIITSWNPAAEKLFGYSAAEAIGSPISIIFPPDKGEEEPEILARLRRGERIDHYETTRVRKDGTRIEVSITISPVIDATGKIIGASKIARDITERKVAEEQIRLERERFRTTLASIGDAVIVTDRRGYVDFMNPVAESLTGWKQDDAHAQPLETVFNIINETSRKRVENPASRAMYQGVIVGLANHTLLIARDGTELAIDDTAAPIRNGDGEVNGVILVFRDVTGLRAVANFRGRLSAIVENSDDAIIGKDLAGKITSWNKGAERLLGYSQQEAIGRPITMLIPADRLAEEPGMLQRLRRGERVDHFETVRITKDRRTVEVSLTISPIRDADGNVVGASKIARDITEKKRAERELERAHQQLRQHAQELEHQVAARTAELRESLRELETFSSSLSHDMKGPLRAISGFAQVLHDEYASQLPADGQQLALRVVESCSRLSRFIDNVLSYTRLKSGGIDCLPLNLNELVSRVIEDYPHAKQAQAEVKIETPLLPVIGNEGLLMQVVANLVSNAVKFVARGTQPKVRIWTEPKGEYVRLWLQDNGIGIPQAEQQRIFDLFARLHSNAVYEGTGIGLAVVQRAVHRMGGNVGVESQDGKGSRFWVELKSP
jgi:PAS domain S-box-containing protein